MERGRQRETKFESNLVEKKSSILKEHECGSTTVRVALYRESKAQRRCNAILTLADNITSRGFWGGSLAALPTSSWSAPSSPYMVCIIVEVQGLCADPDSIDLSLDARLYVSTSIEDILGYRPHEVVGKSCWEYFHPDEIP